MKISFSSVDMYFLVKEFQLLIGAKVQKVYQKEKEEIILVLHSPGKGKKILRILVGKVLYLTDKKQDYGEPGQFCMFLRKNLSNSRIRKIKQLESERIVAISFDKEQEFILYIECFSNGNVILCDGSNIILGAINYKKFKDRDILAKREYSYPKKACNLFLANESEFLDTLNKSDKRSLVNFLAVDLGMGGIYAEEVCTISKIDKNKESLTPPEAKRVFNSIKDLLKRSINAKIYLEDGNIVGITPVQITEEANSMNFPSYNEALAKYYDNLVVVKKDKATAEAEKIQKIIIQQKENVKKNEAEILVIEKRIEQIYSNYNLVNKILTDCKKISKKYSQKDITKRLKNHKTVKGINIKDKRVIVEI